MLVGWSLPSLFMQRNFCSARYYSEGPNQTAPACGMIKPYMLVG